MTTVEDILAAAQALPATERAHLLHALWNSLPPEEWTLPNDDWLNEANRRSDAIDAGELTTESWSTVRERVRRKAGLDG